MIWFEDSQKSESRRADIIRAPFSKASHALLSVALLALLIVGPGLMQRIAPADASKVYLGVPAIYGNYATIGVELAKPGKIDVLIVGSSDAWTSLDPRIIKTYLEAETQRELRVLNLSTNWAGDERTAQLLKDTFRNHEVDLVLLAENDGAPIAPHELAKYWWRGDVATGPLPRRNRAQLEMMSIIGWPRQLWSRAQSRETAPMLPPYQAYLTSQTANLGFNPSLVGWKSHNEPDEANRRPYVDLDAPPPAVSGTDLFLGGDSRQEFEVRTSPYTPMQTPFIVASRDMTRAQGGVFATFSIPTHFGSSPLERPWIRDHEGVTRDWPTIGISQTALFPGLTFNEMLDFYGNESHLNEAGARAYTNSLLPAIGELYAQASTD